MTTNACTSDPSAKHTRNAVSWAPSHEHQMHSAKFVISIIITKKKHERDAHFMTKARGPSISFRLDCKADKAIASLEKECLVTVTTLSSAFSTSWK